MRALLALAVLAAVPAAAQDRPLTVPTRDVDVTYRAMAGPQPVEQRSRFRAADQMLRLDTPSPGLYMIVDQRARTMAMVSEADKGVVDMPLQNGTVPGAAPPNAAYVRRGADTVAGQACTEWETVDNRGAPTLACFTADGVLLRARRGAQVLVSAVRVAYGPLPPGLFTVPAGYNHVAARGGR